jgi:hypothetical protein
MVPRVILVSPRFGFYITQFYYGSLEEFSLFDDVQNAKQSALRSTEAEKWQVELEGPRKSLLGLDRFAIANNDFRAVIGGIALMVTSQVNDCICASLLSPIASLENCISSRRSFAPHGALTRDTLDGCYDIELLLNCFCLTINLNRLKRGELFWR